MKDARPVYDLSGFRPFREYRPRPVPRKERLRRLAKDALENVALAAFVFAAWSAVALFVQIVQEL